ncbi:MAG TPA: hypothetical protein PKV71_01760 [Calditrichia bacterium]|nr:hypothetical protein [Calditrichota bacterium]HQU71551.1 hypothetical protein [Calditrichia bacterium]HQV30568.1 hypothetical protein [Calditrichia bacterium]
MKKIFAIAVLVLISLFSACTTEERIIFFPVPTGFEAIFNINSSNSTQFDEMVVLDGDSLAARFAEQLADGDFSLDDIEDLDIESITYTLIATTDPASVVNAALEISYGGSARVPVYSIQNTVTGDVLDIEQQPTLSAPAINLLTQALKDMLIFNSVGDIVLYTRGDIDRSNVALTLRVNLVATPLVSSTLEIVQPF